MAYGTKAVPHIRSRVDPYLPGGAKSHSRFTKADVDALLKVVRETDNKTTPDEVVDMFLSASQLSRSPTDRGTRDAFESDATQNYFVDQVVKNFDTPEKFARLPDKHQVALAMLMWGFEAGRRGETRGQIHSFSGSRIEKGDVGALKTLNDVPEPIARSMITEQRKAIEGHRGGRFSHSEISIIQRGDQNYVYVFDTWTAGKAARTGGGDQQLTRVFFNAEGKKVGTERSTH